MSFCAIDDKKEQQLMVIWDLGRRCTFSCSYCPPHRKNNWSEMASYEELVTTADSLERYSNIYNQYRNKPFQVSTSFTGGEPTVNSAFFRFLEYLQDKYPHWKRTLTTNGFYSDRKLQTVMQTTDFTTVSYHCESDENQKKQVKRNLQTMLDQGYNYKINIMFHQNDEYFNECIELAKWCDSNNVSYTPRIIGDQGDIKQGLKDKTVHVYSDEQMTWMKKYWDAKQNRIDKPAYEASEIKLKIQLADEPNNVMHMAVDKPKKTVGQKIGRPCCGGRQLNLLANDKWTTSSFVKNNNFKGWSCMINWYFLYIHQEIDKIWHHQTCQVNLEGDIAPICNVTNFEKFCDKLEIQFETGEIPYIRCPKSYCGCGLCVPKAKNDELAKIIFDSHTSNIKPKFIEMKENTSNHTLKKMVYDFDERNGNETV